MNGIGTDIVEGLEKVDGTGAWVEKIRKEGRIDHGVLSKCEEHAGHPTVVLHGVGRICSGQNCEAFQDV